MVVWSKLDLTVLELEPESRGCEIAQIFSAQKESMRLYLRQLSTQILRQKSMNKTIKLFNKNYFKPENYHLWFFPDN